MIQNKHKTADLMRWSLLHCWFDEVKFVALCSLTKLFKT